MFPSKSFLNICTVDQASIKLLYFQQQFSISKSWVDKRFPYISLDFCFVIPFVILFCIIVILHLLCVLLPTMANRRCLGWHNLDFCFVASFVILFCNIFTLLLLFCNLLPTMANWTFLGGQFGFLLCYLFCNTLLTSLPFICYFVTFCLLWLTGLP